jgi:hypothetical protein
VNEGEVFGTLTVLVLLPVEGSGAGGFRALCYCKRCEGLSLEPSGVVKSRRRGCTLCTNQSKPTEVGDVIGMFELLSTGPVNHIWRCVQCHRERSLPTGAMRQCGGNCARCNPKKNPHTKKPGDKKFGRTLIRRSETNKNKFVWKCDTCGVEKEIWGSPRVPCNHTNHYVEGDVKALWINRGKQGKATHVWECKICGLKKRHSQIPKPCLHGGIPAREKPGAVEQTVINGWRLKELRVKKDVSWKHLWVCEECGLERLQNAPRARYRACKHGRTRWTEGKR